MKTAHLLLLSGLLLACSAQAQVYRWVDAAGRVVYSDQPPASGKADKLNLQGVRQPAPSAPAPAAGVAAASAPAAARVKKLSDEVDAMNARVNEHNLKVRQENCRLAKVQLGNAGKATAAALQAAKDNVRNWCLE